MAESASNRRRLNDRFVAVGKFAELVKEAWRLKGVQDNSSCGIAASRRQFPARVLDEHWQILPILRISWEQMMRLRATWVSVVATFISFSNSSAWCDDDIVVPGLGFQRFGGMALIQEAVAQPNPVEVEEALPEDAQAILDVLDKEAAEIRRKAEQELATRREKAIKALQTLQDKYTRDAKLDEAVAIRDKIRKLKVAHLKPIRNPGNMSAYTNKLDQTFFIEVTGSATGSVWGTSVYTYDSPLATAAVHAGVLKAGQRGIVKVTMLKWPNPHFGSTLNGIKSSDWGVYAASYSVEAPEATDVAQDESPASQ